MFSAARRLTNESATRAAEKLYGGTLIPGSRSVVADPDTTSKVIHGRTERASEASRSEAVNNFAPMSFESNLRTEHDDSDRKARSRTRFANPDPTRIKPRTPVDSRAFVKSLRELHPARVPVSGRLTTRARG